MRHEEPTTRREVAENRAESRAETARNILTGELGYCDVTVDASVGQSRQPMGGVWDHFTELEIDADGVPGHIGDSRDGWSATHGSGHPVHYEDVDTLRDAVWTLFDFTDGRPYPDTGGDSE